MSFYSVKPPFSGHSKQRTCHEQRTRHLVPIVTIYFKLPPNSGHLSITDKFFKNRWCPLFREFTISILAQVAQSRYRHNLEAATQRCFWKSKCSANMGVRHGCSPVNLLHIFRTPFPKSTSEWLLPKFISNFMSIAEADSGLVKLVEIPNFFFN